MGGIFSISNRVLGVSKIWGKFMGNVVFGNIFHTCFSFFSVWFISRVGEGALNLGMKLEVRRRKIRL